MDREICDITACATVVDKDKVERINVAGKSAWVRVEAPIKV